MRLMAYAFNVKRNVIGQFNPLFQEQSLANYATAQEAAERLAGGHTFSLPGGIDPSELGVPEELKDWVKIAPGA